MATLDAHAALPTRWRTLSRNRPTEKLPRGLDALVDAWLGRIRRFRTRCQPFLHRAEHILQLESRFKPLSDARLREQLHDVQQVIRLGREDAQTVDRACAMIREVSRRKLDLLPYPEQLAAALAMHTGHVVELATGEGKTLSATMPAILAAWRGRGCHIVTVNDYLAQRDAEWMRPIYEFCGLSVRHIAQEMGPDDRRAAYEADVTYCTNKEVTADYLRDQLILGRDRSLTRMLHIGLSANRAYSAPTVMRGLWMAIVDEADSILVDEAVTPLIIAGQSPNEEQVRAFEQAAELARRLERDRHYRVNHRYREVRLTDAGRQRIAELCADWHGIWSGRRRREELVTQALTAVELYQRDRNYVIQEGKVVIVDEFTGRLMPDRTWRAGLHQAVEAKEALEVQPMKDTLARLSFQRFFRLYPKLAGMTGTAWESRHELWQVYHRQVVRIPTHKPCIRKQLRDTMFADDQAKWRAVVDRIQQLHASGRPVLIGTRSVDASEHLSRLLTEVGLQHQVLNAVRHAEEAQVVAQAGQPGAITVATNMAGRGTDIKLGRGIAELGGLEVIAAERNESERIDRQLFGRCGRQGDPGSAVAYVSLNDEIIRRYVPAWCRRLAHWLLASGASWRERVLRRIVARAQRKAERIALVQRKGVLRHDEWLDEQLGFAGKE